MSGGFKKTQYEQVDNAGTTKVYKGSVAQGAPVTISDGGKLIDEFIVKNRSEDEDEILLLTIGSELADWCIDACGDYLIWTPKGRVSSIELDASQGTITYNAIVNYGE